MLGICNGFQILTGTRRTGRPAAERVTLVCVPRGAARGRERRHTVYDTLRTRPEAGIPVKHGDGCWFADAELLAELEHEGQIVLRYGAGANPNGSVGDVAGITKRRANRLGLMPHPEHAVDPVLGSTDGALLLGSLVDAARLSAAALV